MMRDRPLGAELAALADACEAGHREDEAPEKKVLTEALARRCREIFAREAANGEAGWDEIARDLRQLYGAGDSELHYARLSREIRAGRFDVPGERRDRVQALLWAITLQKLRLSNPRFLAAHGRE